MQITHTLCAGMLLVVAATGPAMSQMYPGADVSVNPGASGRSYLLYPGGRYGRHVGHLLQPGEQPGARIHLHYPIPHRVAKPVVSKPASVAALTPVAAPRKPPVRPHATSDLNSLPEDSATRLVSSSTLASTTPKPAKPVAPPPTRTAATTPPPDTGATMIPFTFGNRPPPRVAAPTATPRAPAAAPRVLPPTRVASAAPAPSTVVPSLAVASGMKKQSTILFAAGESNPASTDANVIHALAGSLKEALSAGATRIQLDAFGGPRGDKSSDSRRLSLKRALVVRELLIEDGVPSEKIDVRAMGGVDDNGVADRVDIFIRA